MIGMARISPTHRWIVCKNRRNARGLALASASAWLRCRAVINSFMAALDTPRRPVVFVPRPSNGPEIRLWSLEQKEPSMSKSGLASIARKRMAVSIISAALLGGAALLPMLGAQGAVQDGSVPMLSSTEFGLLADTEFLPPTAVPGPVTFDTPHPYVRNNTDGQPTFRIGDLTNPILQPWVVARMKRDNDEVLAGKVAFTARASCWPARVPGHLVVRCGARTVYLTQTPEHVLMINA